MPPFQDWLEASWGDFRRRWGRLMAVLGLGGIAVFAAAVLPLIVVLPLAAFHVGALWLAVGLGALASLSAALWTSSWAQSAAVRVALNDETAGESLSRAWGQTAAFSWVLLLGSLAIGGGFCLFVLPGVVLAALLFFAPYYQIAGEAGGSAALGLSWARVEANPVPAVLRLLTAGFLVWLPSSIPYVGWLIAMFWSPFGLVATVRLAGDLRAAAPDARAPQWAGRAIAGFAALCLAGVLAVSVALSLVVQRAAPAAQALSARVMSGQIDPATGMALIAVLQGDATPEQRKQARDFVVAASSGSAAAWGLDVSTSAARGPIP